MWVRGEEGRREEERRGGGRRRGGGEGRRGGGKEERRVEHKRKVSTILILIIQHRQHSKLASNSSTMLTGDREACKNTCLNDCVGGCESESEGVRVWCVCVKYHPHESNQGWWGRIGLAHQKSLPRWASHMSRGFPSAWVWWCASPATCSVTVWSCEEVRACEERKWRRYIITKVWGEVGWGGACNAWGGWCWQLKHPSASKDYLTPACIPIQIASIAPPLPPGTFPHVVRVWTP